ncbi:MAG: ArsR/SmtB family transcription factor [Crocinitomicaceae bacterium]
MGLTKSDLFTEEQNTLAGIAKVLGHPARIAILQYLLNSKDCINTDLVKETGLAQATISQHLKELKACNLIHGTISGNSMNYCINVVKWNEVSAAIADFFNLYDSSNLKNCC